MTSIIFDSFTALLERSGNEGRKRQRGENDGVDLFVRGTDNRPSCVCMGTVLGPIAE